MSDILDAREAEAAYWIRWRIMWLPRLAVVVVCAFVAAVAWAMASPVAHEVVTHDTIRVVVPPNRDAVMARMCHNRLNFSGMTRADSIDILNSVYLDVENGGAVECATWIARGEARQ